MSVQLVENLESELSIYHTTQPLLVQLPDKSLHRVKKITEKKDGTVVLVLGKKDHS